MSESIQTVRLDHLLGVYRVGSGDWSWQDEYDILYESDYLHQLTKQIRENGITEPILLGDDGRVWDGHHRICAAMHIGIDSIPVEWACADGVAPQEPCPQPCEHLSAEDAREGRDCREHPCTCPVAPSPDREKLIAEIRHRRAFGVYGEGQVYEDISVLIDALAAQPVLDESKVAEVLRGHHFIEYGLGYGEHLALTGVAVEYFARALCEAAKRGELT